MYPKKNIGIEKGLQYNCIIIIIGIIVEAFFLMGSTKKHKSILRRLHIKFDKIYYRLSTREHTYIFMMKSRRHMDKEWQVKGYTLSVMQYKLMQLRSNSAKNSTMARNKSKWRKKMKRVAIRNCIEPQSHMTMHSIEVHVRTPKLRSYMRVEGNITPPQVKRLF